MNKPASDSKAAAARGRSIKKNSSRKRARDRVPRLSSQVHEIHLDLFRIPVSRARRGQTYYVLMKGQEDWHRALLEGRAWWVGDELLGRLVDSAFILPPPEKVLEAIGGIAKAMSTPLENMSAGDRQYYVDRDVIDLSNSLICHPGAPGKESKQQLTIYRHMRLAAAARLPSPLTPEEIVVGYCVLDHHGNRVFENVELEPCWLHARERKGTWLERVGVVFADGMVKLGHELARRSWLH